VTSEVEFFEVEYRKNGASFKDKLLLHNRKLYVTWNGTMFVDLVDR